MGNQHIKFMIDFSQLVSPKGFSRADYSIITKNPGKTIYELTELGLTKKGAEALEAIEAKSQPKQEKKAVPIPQPETKQIAQPQSVQRVQFTQPNRLTRPNQTNKNDVAKLYNGRTGLTITMSRKAAEKLQRKNSQQYKITG